MFYLSLTTDNVGELSLVIMKEKKLYPLYML